MITTSNTALALTIVISLFLPALVGLVTHQKMPSAFKAILLLLASAITGLLTQWLTALNDHVPFAWQAAVISVGVAFVTAVATHFGIMIPTGAKDFVVTHGVRPPIDLTPVLVVDMPINKNVVLQSPDYAAQLRAEIEAGRGTIGTASAPFRSDWLAPHQSVQNVPNLTETNSPQVDAKPIESDPGVPVTPRHAASRTPAADAAVDLSDVAKYASPSFTGEADQRIARD